MIRCLLFAMTALLSATPLAAQTPQDQLDARYQRALAAGYKALMLCGAISNAEANGTGRSADSVHQWELTGIYPEIDPIVRDLRYRILRNPAGAVDRVEVDWAEDMPPRLAVRGASGCMVMPAGMTAEIPVSDPGSTSTRQAGPITLVPGPSKGSMASKPGPLDRLFAAAFEGEYGAGTRTSAVLVRRAGHADGWKESAAYKSGFDEHTPQRTWSVAKSIASTLIGAAVARGEASVGASAGLGSDATDPRRRITIDQLLRMASGRYSDTPGNRTDALYFGGATVAETALHWPLVHQPGSVFRYANNDTLAAVAAITPTFKDHPPAELFALLGMDETLAETDWQGSYILSSQVWSTASDLATLGELYLNGGKLADGTRVLPEGWVRYVSTPSGPQPEGEFGYGAGFWLLNRSAGVPPDTFAAFGNRGQYVVIVPSRKLVIVRRGEDPVGARFDIAGFTRDVLAALSDLSQ